MNILVLSTFPVTNAAHGGQIRLLNILDMLRRTGANVRNMGVLGSAHYADTPGFLDFPGTEALLPYIENPFLMEDWALGKLFATDDAFYERLAAEIDFKPDVIHVELPWLFEFAQRLKRERRLTQTKLIYGSENIEHELKYKILSQHFPLKIARASMALIEACELNALRKADATCCVSQNDLDWSRKYTKAPVILAQNGVARQKASLREIAEAAKVTSNHKFALFSASAHPPNITGFFDIFKKGLFCIAPNERLVIAGSAGDAIRNDARAKDVPRLAAVTTAGVISDGVMRGLIYNSQCIVLPITQGGGTNLKTAEAIWSGAHVIATTTAMRGYEQFSGNEGITVTDEPLTFLQAVRHAMAQPRLQISEQEITAREAVLWEKTLLDYENFITNLA